MAKQRQPEALQDTSDLIQMMILTAGAYSLVWFWRSWWIVKDALGLKVSPGWRAVFINFNIHTLARDINWLLDRVKKRPALQPYILLMAMWVSVILRSYGTEPGKGGRNYWYLLVVAVLTVALITAVMVVMQKSLNRYLQKAPERSPIKRNDIIYILMIVSTVSGWLTLLTYLYAAISGTDPLGTSSLFTY
ncbi:MAG TPA: hypothetical protein VFL85_00880 [Candidatus Saccharimonadales bacterium]|nr:hypothetical protein [Candidatus Saccharimonadales bacterium]